MFFRYWFRYFVITCLLFCCSSIASAENTLLVKANQYVIEFYSPQVSQLNSKESDSFQVLDQISNKTQLISSKQVNLGLASLESEIIEYDYSDTFCADLIAAGGVKSCAPNFIYTINKTPNDQKFSNLWGLSSNKGIDAPGAWDVTTGSQNIVIAVIDSGVDYNHPDLKANMWTNPNEIPGNGIDDDNNGYVDDIHGISALNDSGDPMDQNGHGTHVAGTIGAKGNNSQGVTGVNWNVKIMALKFIASNGAGSLSDAMKALQYMTEMKKRGVNIIASNNSWGGRGYSQTLENVISESIQEGIVFVAAAGNEGNNNDNTATAVYPASYQLDGLVTVAAIDENQNIANFSNYGLYSVDIAAPGVNILSTVPGGQYDKLSGTSMAAPHVAGALGLLAAHNSSLNSDALIQALYESGVEYPSLHGQVYTGRKLNLARLLKNIRVPVKVPTPSGGCSYDFNSIAFNPDTNIDSTPVLLRGDEGAFQTVNLPFEFAFYNSKISQINISLNGVIYLANTRVNDYKNSQIAPVNAISVLQTDLISEIDPYGIRVVTNSDNIIISWLAKHYNKRTGGDVIVKAKLSANGRIEIYIEIEDDEVLSIVKSYNTIGINGDEAGEFHTYSYNDPAMISNQTAIAYDLSCVEVPESAEVTSIDGYSINKRGKQIKKVLPKKTLFFNFAGTGTGVFPMQIAINGNQCKSSVDVSITNGIGSFTTKAPRFVKKYKRIKFTVNDQANETLKVGRRRLRKLKQRVNSRVQKKRFLKAIKRDCGRLVNRLSF